MNQSSLTSLQILGTMGSAALLWVAGVAIVRHVGHILLATNSRQIGTLVSTLPFSYVTILMVEKTVGAPTQERLLVTCIACATALIMDGIAFTWFPSLYENASIKKKNPNYAVLLSRTGAGYLLYTFGFTMAWAALTSWVIPLVLFRFELYA